MKHVKDPLTALPQGGGGGLSWGHLNAPGAIWHRVETLSAVTTGDGRVLWVPGG